MVSAYFMSGGLRGRVADVGVVLRRIVDLVQKWLNFLVQELLGLCN